MKTYSHINVCLQRKVSAPHKKVRYEGHIIEMVINGSWDSIKDNIRESGSIWGAILDKSPAGWFPVAAIFRFEEQC